MPCYDILRNKMEGFTTQNAPNLTPYVPLVAGSVARSLACISCYPVELARTRMQVMKIRGKCVFSGQMWSRYLYFYIDEFGAQTLKNIWI